MKRLETIKVLTTILQAKEQEQEALQESIDALRIAIREVECANLDSVTTPQHGTHKEELTNAMFAILEGNRPLHRNIILARVRERGVHVGGISSIGSYLSTDGRFKNVGKGMWTLDESEPMEHSSNGYTQDPIPSLEF